MAAAPLGSISTSTRVAQTRDKYKAREAERESCMKTEARKSFTHGFTLSEQELNRLLDTLTQQLERAMADGCKPVVTFKAKFKNGAIAETNSLDEILWVENVGSGAIVRLELLARDREQDPVHSASVEFTDADQERDSPTSVLYVIKGDDRAWVFVTSSEVEERIKKVKTFSPRRFPLRRWSVILPMLGMLLGLFYGMSISLREQGRAIDNVEAAWRAGQIKDPILAEIDLYRTGNAAQRPPLFYIFVLPLLVIVVGYAGYEFVAYVHPGYNFCWGDYIRVFERKKQIEKYVVIVLITGILVSTAGGIIANFLRFGY